MQAGRLIAQALSYEKDGEFDEAFDLLKAGVDVLLIGVQSEYIHSSLINIVTSNLQNC